MMHMTWYLQEITLSEPEVPKRQRCYSWFKKKKKKKKSSKKVLDDISLCTES